MNHIYTQVHSIGCMPKKNKKHLKHKNKKLIYLNPEAKFLLPFSVVIFIYEANPLQFYSKNQLEVFSYIIIGNSS